ncbi:MAG: hypothetical protein R3195_07775 [Gemmatimonadota bacterium]|nr:hypothetical protein [Gemmatimonadota bacterium]
MDRAERTRSYRRTLAIAIGVSLGAHLLALAWVRLTVPTFADREEARALRVLDLPDDWEDTAIEVVPLETALAAESGAELEGVTATTATAEAPEPAAGGAELALAAVEPVDLSAATPAPTLTLEPVEAMPVAEVAIARSNRGVVLRTGGGTSASTGIDFIATSGAARDAEREREGDGWGGLGGIGVGVVGGGGDCPTSGGVPFINPFGGSGGVPTTGPGMGIIGARPPTTGAINRFGPRIGGGR